MNTRSNLSPRPRTAQPLFYPILGGEWDLGLVRLSGQGLGNSFYTYFHAYLLARKHEGKLIYPAWLSLKMGPLRRGDASKRVYSGLFRPMPDEIAGLKKFLLLQKAAFERNMVAIGDEQNAPSISPSQINLVYSQSFTFKGLHEDRAAIRTRLLSMIREAPPAGFTWGNSPYVVVHVRLGDFAKATDVAAVNGGVANTRIPISWYVNLIQLLKERAPDRPILIVSDGREAELADLISAGAKLVRTGSDIGDLLLLSSASLLVGSNSTFSRWAAFLGDMPAIWSARPTQNLNPSLDDAKMHYLPVGTETSLEPDAV
ncbi:Glycosyl transferase family 11 [Bradyrhizobium sp. Rc2d]|uniref:alpha-1,2-fucosyltransferase n=1 Tax=Bradyrhizobium sp. Rc2d TaxID=1855321 RepID=UPI00088F88E2|nr:alpha-1,2-fucosyltransferase [Bradyrhizobium sp. Rc2d]SDH20533.1 Glycosyl transferase family 11 [Bradyrhizobium sp. Rc2d]